jgi:hypothetical protein
LNDYRLSVEPNDGFTEHVERIHMSWQVPEWWAAGVGEVMYHLRSALDNLVWQLVLANGHEPGNQNEFPIAEDPCWYEKRSGAKLRGVPDAARSVIENVQPYKGPAEQLHAHPLWVIHNLNRIDKHHLLHVVAAYPSSGNFEVTPEMAAVEGGQMRLWYRPLEDGTEVRSFITPVPFHGEVPVGEVVTLNVVLRETDETPFYTFPVFMRECLENVRRIVDGVVASAK